VVKSPGFKDKTVIALVLLVSVSIALIIFSGPNLGIDLEGGTRMRIRAETTEITVENPGLDVGDENEVIDWTENIEQRLEEGLDASVRPILPEGTTLPGLIIEQGEGIAEYSIDRRVEEHRITRILNEPEVLTSHSHSVSPEIMDELIEKLRQRVDPGGTLYAAIRRLGDYFVNLEVPLDPEEAESRIGRPGRLEVYIQDKLVLEGEDILSVDSPVYRTRRGYEGYEVPFRLTVEGHGKWAEAVEGMAGHPGVIYLDRPTASVLLFGEEFLEELEAQAEIAGYSEIEYVEEDQTINFRIQDFDEMGRPVPGEWFPLQVDALKMEWDRIPESSKEYMLKNIDTLNRAIYLGSEEDIDNALITDGGSLTLNDESIPLTFRPRVTEPESETYVDWLSRVVGLEANPTIQEEVADDPGREMVITTGEDPDYARNLYIVMSQELPVQVEIMSIERLDPRLGEDFISEAIMAAFAALIAVGMVIYIRYRRFKIAMPMMMTMLSEVIIVLGISSLLPRGLMAIGIPEIGAIIAVIGLGVDHQIMITDEVLGDGGFGSGKKVAIDRRTRKAFSIIFAAAATTVAAMIALATVGLGAIRGFAIVTIIGVTVSVLVTRPAYAKIVGTLLEREQENY